MRLPNCPLCYSPMGFFVYHPDAELHPPVKKRCKRCKNVLRGRAREKVNPLAGEPERETATTPPGDSGEGDE